MTTPHEELISLASLYCEEQLTDGQHDRLQDLLRSDRKHQLYFIELVQLHGQLTWDAGLIQGSSLDSADEDLAHIPFEQPVSRLAPRTAAASGQAVKSAWTALSRSLVIASASLMAALAIGFYFRNAGPGEGFVKVPKPAPDRQIADNSSQKKGNPSLSPASSDPLEPVIPERIPGSPDETIPQDDKVAESDPADGVDDQQDLSDATVIAAIDQMIQSGWTDSKVSPAEEADDHEWVRRTYLILTGRIASIDEVTAFMKSPAPRKRDALLDQLLENPLTSENLAVTWTNLLIGRSNSRGVDEDSLYQFLMEQFTENRPWMETVGQLIAAEGRSDENGATNFLLAHLNDQATPATAVTARLFLGQQVHCTQCHAHPFAKERQQEEFWSLNAFFKQAERQQLTVSDANGKERSIWLLEDSGQPGMTIYETLAGQMKAALPEFAGQTLEAESTASRRSELAKLLAVDDKHQVARAMVNRMWAQFFGYGFTTPVDDMGAHNPVSNPELFDYLTNAFVRSDYDLRRMMRWLTMSQAFRLSSIQTVASAGLDDPQEGGTPLFSRAYPRQMGPEQVYDSIRIALRSVASQQIDSSVGSDHRRQWVDQFVKSYGTDENDEQLEFSGNISQAFLMMNGPEIQDVIPLAAREATESFRDNGPSVTQITRLLSIATLNREPTKNEQTALRTRYRALKVTLPADEAMRTAAEDMLWAYLNSSEFVSVH